MRVACHRQDTGYSSNLLEDNDDMLATEVKRNQFVDSASAVGLARPPKAAARPVQSGQSDLKAPSPCASLTDNQYAEYRALMSQAAALNAAGRSQEARVIAHLAANILRTGAPALE